MKVSKRKYQGKWEKIDWEEEKLILAKKYNHSFFSWCIEVELKRPLWEWLNIEIDFDGIEYKRELNLFEKTIQKVRGLLYKIPTEFIKIEEGGYLMNKKGRELLLEVCDFIEPIKILSKEEN